MARRPASTKPTRGTAHGLGEMRSPEVLAPHPRSTGSGYLCLPWRPGSAQARVEVPGQTLSLAAARLDLGVLFSGVRPGRVPPARRGSRRVCSARNSVARPRLTGVPPRGRRHGDGQGGHRGCPAQAVSDDRGERQPGNPAQNFMAQSMRWQPPVRGSCQAWVMTNHRLPDAPHSRASHPCLASCWWLRSGGGDRDRRRHLRGWAGRHCHHGGRCPRTGRPQPAACAQEWLLRLTPTAAHAIQQTIPAYPQVAAMYTPSSGDFPLALPEAPHAERTKREAPRTLSRSPRSAVPAHAMRHVRLLQPGYLLRAELELLGGQRVLDVAYPGRPHDRCGHPRLVQ
jgi:hypothetical protein